MFKDHPYRSMYIMQKENGYHVRGKRFSTLHNAKQWVDEFYGYHHLDNAMDNITADKLSFANGMLDYVPTEPQPITDAQKRVLTSLCADILESDGVGEKWMGDYEYKRFEIKQHRDQLIVYTVVGRKGDEDTMAAVLCRHTRHFVIGPRGGIKTLRGKKSKCTNYRRFIIWGSSN